MTWSSNDPSKSIIFREKTKIGDYVGQTIMAKHPFLIGSISYWYNNNIITTSAIYSNLQIGSNAFYDIVRINETNNVTESLQSTDFYISKNVGIVKNILSIVLRSGI